MKIAILTQPLFFNYGGILQAYALQTILNRLGHTSQFLRRDLPTLSDRFPNNVVIDFKYIIRKLFGKNNTTRNTRHNRIITKETRKFINCYLNVSPSLYSDRLLKSYAKKYDADGYIVGSDQVWRPSNSPNILNFFLDFCKESKVKRIVYAASFGVDDWEFSDIETSKCQRLVQRFDAVSVRESSGVTLCRDYLKIDAKHVLDPTMLLDRSDYEHLCSSRISSTGDIFNYILDSTEEKKSIIRKFERSLGYKSFDCMPKLKDSPDNIDRFPNECVYPPVEHWINSFINAKIVITDSFHGTVFSIIFNKPFWVIVNKERGLARFKSLLSMFHLENRIIESYDSVTASLLKREIDWNRVNQIRKFHRKESLEFLENALS